MSSIDASTYALYIQRAIQTNQDLATAVNNRVARVTGGKANNCQDVLGLGEQEALKVLTPIATAIHSKNYKAIETDTPPTVEVKVPPVITKMPVSKPAEKTKDEQRREDLDPKDTVDYHFRQILRIAGAAGPLYSRGQIEVIVKECMDAMKQEMREEMKEIAKQAVKDTLKSVV